MKVSLSRFVFFQEISTVLFAIVIAERMHALTQLLLFAICICTYAIETMRLQFGITIRKFTRGVGATSPRHLPRPVRKVLHGHVGRQGRCTAAAFSHVGDDLCILGGAGVVVSAIPRGT